MQVAMFKCHVCGGASARSELVSEVFALGEGRRVLVARIPAQVCERCGKAKLIQTTREAAEQLKELFESDPAGQAALRRAGAG